MKHFIYALVFMLYLFSSVYGQTIEDKLGVGFNFGGQKIYGDIENTGFGIAFETYAKYLVNDRFFMTGALGYGELSDGTFGFDKSTFITNLINFDIRAGYNLAPNSKFQPYAHAGLGIINFKYNGWDRFFDGTWFLGGGAEWRLSPSFSLDAYSDYRWTTGDDFDGRHAQARDGYLNIRGGFTYYLTPRRPQSGPKVIAEKVPIEELSGAEGDEEFGSIIDGIEDFEESEDSNMTMEEFIRLKSRADELGDAIRQKELEIEELKAQLESRRDRLAQLENGMQTRNPALASSMNMNVDDYATSYEQALENFYAKEYDAAIYIFNMLLEEYPNHRLASNSQYWLGECYFGKNDYDAALGAFSQVFDFSRSVKNDDALLMMGRCYSKLGNHQMARQMYERLMTEYPESEYYSRASRYTDAL
ncbi:tetratricopeptide repeat protein [candidate division KSB1 bacterium]|nr:tetratricopeptide repeat protein [candidate division KSB1 bacterium]